MISMNILCIDHDMYVITLDRVLRRMGGRAHRVECSAAITAFRSRTFDAILIDVEPYAPFEDCDPYEVLMTIAAEWAGDRPVCLYTQASERKVEKRLRAMGLRADRVEFYSKRKIEIPPLIDCIAQEIFESPYLISLDVRKLLPPAITADWIAAQPSIAKYLETYIGMCCSRDDWDKVQLALAKLPSGLRWLWSISGLRGEVDNGGFAQFISNGFRSNPERGPVPECLEAARGLELNDLADLLQSSWAAIEPAVRNNNKAELNKALDEFDRRFYAMSDSLTSWIDRYVKAHPAAFLHGPD
jgi:hypothetical protein